MQKKKKKDKRGEGLSVESCWTIAVTLFSNSVIFILSAQDLRDPGASYSLPVVAGLTSPTSKKKDFSHQTIGYMLDCSPSIAIFLALVMLSLFSQKQTRITPPAAGGSVKVMWAWML